MLFVVCGYALVVCCLRFGVVCGLLFAVYWLVRVVRCCSLLGVCCVLSSRCSLFVV